MFPGNYFAKSHFDRKFFPYITTGLIAIGYLARLQATGNVVVGQAAAGTTVSSTGVLFPVGTYSGRGNPTGSGTSRFRVLQRGYNGVAEQYSAIVPRRKLVVSRWHRWDILPGANSEEVSMFTNDISDDAFAQVAHRIKSDGKMQLHDLDDIASNTPTNISSNAIATDNKYWIVKSVDLDAATVTLTVKGTNGRTVASVTISSASLGSDNLNALWLGKTVNRNGQDMDQYDGDIFVADDDSVTQGYRTKLLMPSGNAGSPYDGFSIGAGPTKWEAVRGSVLTGDSGNYITSTTQDEVYACAVALPDDLTIDDDFSDIIAVQPFVNDWRPGSSTFAQTGLIQDSKEHFTLADDPGAVASNHLRGILYRNDLYGDPWTKDNVGALKVAIKHTTNANELRCGKLGLIIVYDAGAPGAGFGGRGVRRPGRGQAGRRFRGTLSPR